MPTHKVRQKRKEIGLCLCQCRCGELIPEINKLGHQARYKHGHHRQGKKFPNQKGSPRPTCRGKPTWNKGNTWSQEVRNKIALAHQGKKDGPMSEERKQKIAAAQKGKPRPYARNIPQIFKKGQTPWNKDKTGVYTEETLQVIRAARAKQIFPFKNTSIEVAIHTELDKLGIQYSKNW